MALPPIEPARLEFEGAGIPISTQYGDRYHPQAGGLQQAREVFLQGCGLPQAWCAQPRFTVLETGFGLGHNFLATWQAWREHAARPHRLEFVSIERHPVDRISLRRVHEGHELASMARELAAQWPPALSGIHRLSFDGGRVVLWLVLADVERAVRDLRVTADALFLDGFAPRCNPQMWSVQVLKALGRLARTGARLSTWCAAGQVRRDLVTAGFEVTRHPGFAGKRERTQAVYKPRPGMRTAPTDTVQGSGEEPVLILGAGLAGAACAQALAAAGVACTVIDRHEWPAQEASGNPAGLFHGVVHADDGLYARLIRAAALMAERAYRPLIENGEVAGSMGGLLRLEARRRPAEMVALLTRLGLPEEYAQVRLPDPPSQPAAWFYPGGGWIDPGAWVRRVLQAPGISFMGGTAISGLARHGDAWVALGPSGQPVAEARRLILCTASLALLEHHDSRWVQHWRTGRQRGQITGVPAQAPGVVAPALPISGGGYALTDRTGTVWCGATATHADEDPSVRTADHLENLARLATLTGSALQGQDRMLQGRVAWRFQTRRRLPLAGPVRGLEGLHLATALGSRGITWAPLVGQVLAHWLTGSMAPLPAPLMDALDPRHPDRGG